MGLRDESKKNWSTISGQPTHTELQVGCMQRIADSMEVMAQNYLQLQKERDMYMRWAAERQQRIDRMQRRISALRGVITRMKRKRRRG